MEIEIAERASKIIKEINELHDMKKELKEADNVTGNINFGCRGLGFKWAKGHESGKYIEYIILGINLRIAQLKDELKKL